MYLSTYISSKKLAIFQQNLAMFNLLIPNNWTKRKFYKMFLDQVVNVNMGSNAG
jgi:hypothetical protein